MTDKEKYKERVSRILERLERNFGKASKQVVNFKIAVAEAGNLDDPLKEKIAMFLLEYAFFDHQELYTNGALVVPFARVVDALRQNGEEYREAGA